MNDTYQWDPDKEAINIQKHGISFIEAETVFDDVNALYKPDIDHSYDEERFIIIGYSSELRLLIVCHCYRENDAIVRIISARKATNFERNEYEGKLI